MEYSKLGGLQPHSPALSATYDIELCLIEAYYVKCEGFCKSGHIKI